ncbi:MAG: UDP-N-acetylglucosamine 2-epimerase (non-hydrolyzing) [Verrucomicrobia bacterium]|nr:UDP-N-acetylglucosamine 2-epimerase (non-hydrolyzing) [Verrucomicrobiota bacterium]
MKRKLKVLSVIGTRPEAIKMAPLIRELSRRADRVESLVVSTAQHRQMLDQTLRVFGIVPDIDLDIMRPRQSLRQTTVDVLTGMEPVLRQHKPDVLLVQGDTTSAWASALAGFHQKTPVGHVEAGLRSFDLGNPYPEEMNRRLTDALASFHFAPTARARDNLLREGFSRGNIFVTGNTVVDALQLALRMPFEPRDGAIRKILDAPGRLLLVTAHRRENWGKPLAEICDALRKLVRQFPDLRVVCPVHLNPEVRQTVMPTLKRLDRIHLIQPVDYLTLAQLMKRAHLILTDSGGLQEEAPTFGKPVLVMRKCTERPEATDAGWASLVGTRANSILSETRRLLMDSSAYARMIPRSNPYGDGQAARRIVDILLR